MPTYWNVAYFFQPNDALFATICDVWGNEYPLSHTTVNIVFSMQPCCRLLRMLAPHHSMESPKDHRVNVTKDFLRNNMAVVISPANYLSISEPINVAIGVEMPFLIANLIDSRNDLMPLLLGLISNF
jgi:hypothetical protein